ncbi:hypothetical protein PIB30_104293, partial [Stylosanthes scabra]|nr:hypothetical protein [Stylosanthes scabra]
LSQCRSSSSCGTDPACAVGPASSAGSPRASSRACLLERPRRATMSHKLGNNFWRPRMGNMEKEGGFVSSIPGLAPLHRGRGISGLCNPGIVLKKLDGPIPGLQSPEMEYCQFWDCRARN